MHTARVNNPLSACAQEVIAHRKARRDQELADAITHTARLRRIKKNKELKEAEADRIYGDRLIASAKKAYTLADTEAKREAKTQGFSSTHREEELFWTLYDENLAKFENPMEDLKKWLQNLPPARANDFPWSRASTAQEAAALRPRERGSKWAATSRPKAGKHKCSDKKPPPKKKKKARVEEVAEDNESEAEAEDAGEDRESDAEKDAQGCWCDGDNNMSMILCSGCDAWVHYKCEGLNREKVKAYRDSEYHCSRCLEPDNLVEDDA